MTYVDTRGWNGRAPVHGRHAAVGSWPRTDDRRSTWPLVADDMFRLAHRDSDGAPWLDPQVAGMGLAAALLGELLLTERLLVQDGVVVVKMDSPPVDLLAHGVLDRLLGEPVAHPVRTWLTYLGRSSYLEVAERLERAGHVRVQVSRRPFRRSVRHVPTDMNAAAWPWARLVRMLLRGELMDDFDVMLAGLAVATDLHCVALVGDAGRFAEAQHHALKHAATPVRELVSHTHAAVGDAVITGT